LLIVKSILSEKQSAAIYIKISGKIGLQLDKSFLLESVKNMRKKKDAASEKMN